jgi:hypothetical protein
MSHRDEDDDKGFSPEHYLGLNNPETGQQPLLRKPFGSEVGWLLAGHGDDVFNNYGYKIGHVDRDRGIFYESGGSEPIARPLGRGPGILGSPGPIGGPGPLGG